MKKFFARAVGAIFMVVFAVMTMVPSPSLAAGTCTRRCTRGSETRNLPALPVADERACTASCAPLATSCGAGYVCEGLFVADPTPPTPPTRRLACSCVCVETRGGTGPSVTVTSDETCPRISAAARECDEPCNTRCTSGRAPVRSGMVRSFDGHPACGEITVSPPTAPAAGGATSPSGSTTPGTPAASSPTTPTTPSRPPVPLTLAQPIGGVSVVRDFGDYIAVIYRYAIGMAGTAAAIMLVYGGFLYLLGSVGGEVAKGKTVIQDALIGLVLVLASYAILSIVNPNTLSLHVPEIGTMQPQALVSQTVTTTIDITP